MLRLLIRTTEIPSLRRLRCRKLSRWLLRAEGKTGPPADQESSNSCLRAPRLPSAIRSEAILLGVAAPASHRDAPDVRVRRRKGAQETVTAWAPADVLPGGRGPDRALIVLTETGRWFALRRNPLDGPNGRNFAAVAAGVVGQVPRRRNRDTARTADSCEQTVERRRIPAKYLVLILLFHSCHRSIACASDLEIPSDNRARRIGPWNWLPIQASRKATMGSIRIARRAGR